MKTVVYEKATEVNRDELDFEMEHLKQKLNLVNQFRMTPVADELIQRMGTVDIKKLGYSPLNMNDVRAMCFSLLWGFGCRTFRIRDGRPVHRYDLIDGYHVRSGNRNEVSVKPVTSYLSKSRPMITLEALKAMKEFQADVPRAIFHILYADTYVDPIIVAHAFSRSYFVAAWGEPVMTLKEMVELYGKYERQKWFQRMWNPFRKELK